MRQVTVRTRAIPPTDYDPWMIEATVYGEHWVSTSLHPYPAGQSAYDAHEAVALRAAGLDSCYGGKSIEATDKPPRGYGFIVSLLPE